MAWAGTQAMYLGLPAADSHASIVASAFRPSDSAFFRDMMTTARAFFDRTRVEEDRKLTAALEKVGVDWSQAAGTPPAGAVEMTLAPLGGSRIKAGDSVKLRGTVRNTGTTPVHRVHAVLKSENGRFDENEMVFGRINPGESRNYDLTVKVPKSMPTATPGRCPPTAEQHAGRGPTDEPAVEGVVWLR